MERLPVQSWGWRTFALLAIVILSIVAPRLPVQYASPIWQLVKNVYWCLAPVGLLGYAFGVRVRPLGETFWRFYAIIFTADISWRCIRFLARLRLSDESTGRLLIAGLLLGAILYTCIALLRYANLVGGGRTADVAAALR